MMDPNFWHQRWEKNEIAFHEVKAHPFLVKHCQDLLLPKGRRIFVPLCGKTLDISWLISKGYCVAGAELSPLAIEQLFMELGMQPEISQVEALEHWSAKQIDIFVGDLFELSRTVLGPVDAVYDRAALVALPEHMRTRYAVHLVEITHRVPQLLICYDYDQRLRDGPPFAVSNGEVHRHYAHQYEVTLLDSAEVLGGLKGTCPATENVWLLRPK
jgi:thiopurine S-methyltransferase